MTQLRSLLQVVFPEFEAIFPLLTKKTPFAILRAFPTPEDLLKAPKAKVLRVLHSASRGHLGAETYERLIVAAKATLGLPGAQGRLRQEIGLVLERLALFETQIKSLETAMVDALQGVPETPYLLSIPKVAPVTAAVFLGSIGDPRAYESSGQILRVAGLSLIERSSGIPPRHQADLQAGPAAAPPSGVHVRGPEYHQGRPVPGRVRGAVPAQWRPEDEGRGGGDALGASAPLQRGARPAGLHGRAAGVA
ncbi:MAG: IS110 family transposase [Gemmatimonadetes bacterium]|nr:IS110 family transposase [Gemmatimonadota bacterium]